MAEEDTYEYECMRAELLGTEKPSLDEYMSKKKQEEAEAVKQEEIQTENLKELENESEQMKNTSGKLHELTSLLSATQKKINRFKVSYGALTNFLKTKMGNAGASEPIVSNSDSKSSQEIMGVDNTSMTNSPKMEDNRKTETVDHKNSDMARALDNHVDKLDLLIEKAENCQYSMQHQNKEMKRFLK